MLKALVAASLDSDQQSKSQILALTDGKDDESNESLGGSDQEMSSENEEAVPKVDETVEKRETARQVLHMHV